MNETSPPDDPRFDIRRMIFLALLDELGHQEVVQVFLDPRRHGVGVPDYLRADDSVCLKYSYQFAVPMDLVADELGIAATLTFSGGATRTFVPWTAIRYVFASAETTRKAIERLAREDKKKTLRLVADDEKPPEGPAGEAEAAARREFGGLRLVKGGSA